MGIQAIGQLWYRHGQKTLATMLAALSVVDLTGYHDSIAAITSEKGYHFVRLVGAAGIIWRAIQASNSANSGNNANNTNNSNN